MLFVKSRTAKLKFTFLNKIAKFIIISINIEKIFSKNII